MGDFLWRMFGMETDTVDIQDRIFLLSGPDLDRHFEHEGLFYSGVSTVGTEAVRSTAGEELCWWMRSSMREHPFAHIVSPCDSVGGSVIRGDNLNGVRPAMWVRLEGFYPEDENQSMNSVFRAFNKEEFSMLFGGQFQKQWMTQNLTNEFRKMEAVNPKYNRFVMKYGNAYHRMVMPCGTLIEANADPDEADII